MKTFNVYKHPTNGFKMIKVGFSWLALFFGLLWMLFKKQWETSIHMVRSVCRVLCP